MFDKIVRIFLILLVGIGLGYGWRMMQEKGIKTKIEEIRNLQREVTKDFTKLEVRLSLLEGKGKKR